MRALIAGVIFCITSSAFAADTLVPVRQVTVTGSADRKVTPDVAHVNVTINGNNLKVEAAKAEHDKKLQNVIAIAKAEGIDEAHIKTQNSSIQPQYTYENNKRIFKGYSVQTSLDIKVKKIESLGALLDKLTSAKIESSAPEWQNLLSVSYSIDSPDKIRDEMLAEAIKNARSKAEKMAAAAGTSIGRVLTMNEGNTPSFEMRPMPMMARASMDGVSAKSAVTPPPGEQEVNASVSVTFELN